MRYLSHTPDDVSNMLDKIGRPDLPSLFESIPKACRLQRELKIPPPGPELTLKKELMARCASELPLSFLGAGATRHFVPEMVSQMLLRGDWYTAYTPYQPEMAQGTLQAIFEFQTMVASLYGCEIANASMYDGATALAEALLMAVRIKPDKRAVAISNAVHPEYRQVCKTYLDAAGIEIIDADAVWHERVAAFAYQTPNFFGQLENQAQKIGRAHAAGALAIAVNTDPTAFGIIEAPGKLGADIVVGEGIGLCGHLSLGAPGVGLFATSNQFLRQMPGRLVGETTDTKGKRGFVLTLSTREQHIRRERATSNICTNHSLMALAFSISLSLYGKTGLVDLARRNLARTIQFRKMLTQAGIRIAFQGVHYNETVVELKASAAVERAFSNLVPGVKLSAWYPELDKHLLICTTELHNTDDLKTLVKELAAC